MRERERRTLLRLAAKDARPIGHNDSLTDESDDHVSPDSHSSDGASTDIRTRLAEIRVEAIPLESEGNNNNLG
ncbi:hypothetical protein D915_007315 [Fasciola hepatica]|uniref:Uncharacterized protein n=1 Tax=Fasciola hepatica TaxID=6192 RepID=A0A4E0R2Q3_FASHE|nr:hypothetical protein D915_007315 [Fasciola hepatica]